MKFANLFVDSCVWKNMGDDMMIAAVFNLYKYMGIEKDEIIRIPVSQLRSYDGEPVILPLNYPFYGNFTLSPKIHPVFIAISALHKSVIKNMHLKEFEPIGCRDLHTFRMLKNEGVNAYINGCMTITLPKVEQPANKDKIYLIDIPEELKKYLPEWVRKNAVETTQNFFDADVAKCTEAYTYKRYREYIENAKIVVSSRLHCILPCAAAGIPTILTLKKKSFRYNWLENIMPIYTPENFNSIDWNPVPLDFEKEKEMLLSNAANRVWNEYHRLETRPQIEKIYMNTNEEYAFESLIGVISYLNKNWDNNNNNREYILWGVTQTAELIYEYIQAHYPDAKLKGIIDKFHRQKWHDILTDDENIINDNNAVVFITAESANEYAKRFMAGRNVDNYVVCWNNPRTKNS